MGSGMLRPTANVNVAFPLGPLFLTWASNNSAPYTTRAVSSAMVVSLGSLGPIVSAWVYLPSESWVFSLSSDQAFISWAKQTSVFDGSFCAAWRPDSYMYRHSTENP
jgi:hypothetical protein